jgi:hypothetical protein
LKQKRALVSL